jgi:hypothetical protein
VYEETEYGNAPSEEPPSRRVQQEFMERHKQAHHRANELTEQAREWRRIENACLAALETFKASEMEQKSAVAF